MSQEKTEEDEWPRCVFYPEIKCSVRKEMRSGIDKYVKPPLLKGTDEAQMVTKMLDPLKSLFQNEWMMLHGFCQICPFKVRIDRAVLQATVEETMAVMKVAKEQLQQEGVLPK